MGWKIITKNRRKSPHPSSPEPCMPLCCCLFLISTRNTPRKTYWISKFNTLDDVENQHRHGEREKIVAHGSYAQSGFCCVLFRIRIRKIVSENLFSHKSFVSLATAAAYLSHEHRVRRFSVNRKTFLSLQFTLTYPMQVCFQPRRRFTFSSESRLWEICVRSQTRRT